MVELRLRDVNEQSLEMVDSTNPLPVKIISTALTAPLLTNYQSGLTTTAIPIKIGPGRLYAVEVSNPNTVSIWVQLFDLQSGQITLGTTPPKLSMMIPKGASATDAGGMDKLWADGVEFTAAITAYATTTPTGLTAPATALSANFFYK